MSAAGSMRPPFDVAALAEQVLERAAELAACTETPGSIQRTFLCAAMDEVHAKVRCWAADAGLAVSLDLAGNLHASSTPALAGTPRLLLHSHLDTVPNGGAFDGALGVLLGLALAAAWHQHGRADALALDVIGFSEEEGVRFGVPFLGSHMAAGTLPAAYLDLTEQFPAAGRTTLRDTLEGFVRLHSDALPPALPQHAIAALEFHIEQGPVLESRGLPLAAVTAIVGQVRGTVVFRGKAGHAGTTPMALRHDALAAAAEWMCAVESYAKATDGLAATVGQIAVTPGAANVIPGEAMLTLDLRHAVDAERDAALGELLRQAQAIGSRRGVAVSWQEKHRQAAVAMDPALTALAADAIAETTGAAEAPRLLSGAGHDSMILAPHLPATMIFLRSPGGLSHHPEESVHAGDVALALAAGWRFLERLAATGSAASSYAIGDALSHA